MPAGAAAADAAGDPSINDLTQAQLADAIGAPGASTDVALVQFQSRVAAAPSQVLRYCRWPPSSGPAAAATAAAAASAAASAADAATAASAAAAVSAASTTTTTTPECGGSDDDDGDALGAPLWFSDAHQPLASDVPPCEHCGAARSFELQVMPQALNYVLPPPLSDAPPAALPVELDFGTLAVYTCTGSCNAGAGQYVREWVWAQVDKADGGDIIGGGASAGAGVGGAVSAL